MGNTNSSHLRVAVVGAGFSGLVAARELELLGHDVSMFEARDRIGGRAWTDERLGASLEMGATWVHWYQPFIWTEIMRYRQEIYPSPEPTTAVWIAGGQRFEGTAEEAEREQHRVEARVLKDSRDFFPYPYDPTHVLDGADVDGELARRFREADHRSVLDILREEGASQLDIDIADSYWSAAFQGSADEGSSLMATHQAAICDHRMKLLDDAALRFKLRKGMRGLYESIAVDLRADIQLNTPITGVETRETSVILAMEEERREFDAVIVTVPTGALGRIAFSPELSPSQRKLVESGCNSMGVKAWIEVEGEHQVMLTAPRPAPLTVAKTEVVADGRSIIVGFGPDHTQIDLTSRESAQEALDIWGLDLQVRSVTGHDWVSDPWSGQTWSTPRRGQFLDGRHHFREQRGRVRFAGSDWALGWNGVFVDGALESGITTARDLVDEFGRAS